MHDRGAVSSIASLVTNRVQRPLRKGLRYSRLLTNLVAGGAFIQACHQFPGVSKIQQHHLNDYRAFNFWVDDLARSMNTQVHVHGRIMDEPGLFVSNHISWLDTIVLNKVRPLSFIARHDLKDWPFLGTFTTRMSSVFVDRSNKFQAYRSIPALEERLNEGRSVMLFPESTTSDGSKVLPFYSMFFEAAVRTGKKVQPLAIRYTDAAGVPITEPAFIGEDSFVDTLDRILALERVHAHLHFLSPLDARRYDRKYLCRRSKKMIAAVIAQADK